MQRVLDSEYDPETGSGVDDSALSRVMLHLGEFSFSVDTLAYQSISQEGTWNWVEQARTGKTDLLQYAGMKAPTKTFEGQAHALMGSSLKSLGDIYQQGLDARPLLMVSGTGQVMGYWVIKSVSDTASSFLPGGMTRQKSFNMTIQFYGFDLSDP